MNRSANYESRLMMAIQCDLALKESPYVPCDLCGSTELYKGVQRMPCFQSKLEELLFFRSGS